MQCIRALESLIPINAGTSWSYKPVDDEKDLTKTMSNFAQMKVNRLQQKAYIDCGLAGDNLSSEKTIQCFPITNYQDNGRNAFEGTGYGNKHNKKFQKPGPGNSGGFFSRDVKNIY